VEIQDKIGLCKKTVIIPLKVVHYLVGRLNETTKNLCHSSLPMTRDSNPGPLEHKERMLTMSDM